MTDMPWHADGPTLARYLDGTLGEAYACSVEAHLMGCEQCRLDLAGTAAVRDSERAVEDPTFDSQHERTWARVLEEADRPSSGPVSRLLGRWVPDHELRPIVAAPALRNAGCAAGLAVLASAAVIANLRPVAGAAFFLIAAPIVPLVAVALAYGRPDELCGEIADALPYSRFRLLLARTLAVVGLTLPVTMLLSLALPIELSTAMLWLAPSLALCSLTLALSSWLDARVVAVGLVVLWIITTTDTWQEATSTRIDVHQLVEGSFVFDPAGQVVLLCIAAVALAVAIVRRSTYDLRRAA
jgi:hypothetical protein